MTSRVLNSDTSATAVHSTRSYEFMKSKTWLSITWPELSGAPTPRDLISRPNARDCWRSHTVCQPISPTITKCSSMEWSSTTHSIHGAVVNRPKRAAKANEGVRIDHVAELSILQSDRTELRHGVSLRAAFWVWLRVALLSFGGPAGQIAVMHRILVEEKRWISESRFMHALNYCMLLPGPEAQQLATYFGWLMHRTGGGIMAGVLFVLPGLVAIMALSYVYAAYGNVPAIAAEFFRRQAPVPAMRSCAA